MIIQSICSLLSYFLFYSGYLLFLVDLFNCDCLFMCLDKSFCAFPESYNNFLKKSVAGTVFVELVLSYEITEL